MKLRRPIARARKLGLAELADGGTLFLDDVGEMPPNNQPKPLRFLEDSRFKRVGGTNDIRVNVRVIAGTNHDLSQMVELGTFRSDLYSRLRVVPIHIPPLRERPEDIEPLAPLFLEQLARELKRDPVTLADPTLRLLEAYAWPGNVRELRNLLERILILEDVKEILPEHLPVEIGAGRSGTPAARELREIALGGLCLVEVEKDLFRRALVRTRGNVTQAANLLGISRDTLRYRLTKFPELAHGPDPKPTSM